MATKKVQAWACGGCDNIYRNSQSAIACSKRHEKEEKLKQTVKQSEAEFVAKSDKVRLNCDDITKLPQQVEEFFKNEYNLDIKLKYISLRFGKLSLSHNCPIGGKTNWGRRDSDLPYEALGWSGRIAIKSNIGYKTPFVYSRGNRKIEVTSALDVISSSHNGGLIRGINTGCGGGNEFEVLLYLQDFPKVEAQYTKFAELSDKRSAYVDKLTELSKEANQKLIDSDETIIGLYKAIDFHLAMEKKTRHLISKTETKISKSDAFLQATKVPAEYDYDEKELERLDKIFR